MSNLRRYYSTGSIYFVTCVTYKRRPVLIDNISLLRDSFKKVYKANSYKLYSWVILPDHIHLIIDPMNNSLSSVIQRIKMSFYMRISKYKSINGRIWQYRFWDHRIRNENDFKIHLNYIHYNPVKHNYTNDPFIWSHSSLNKFYNNGYYQRDWGAKDIKFDKGFGE